MDKLADLPALLPPFPDQLERPKPMLRFPYLISALLLLFLGDTWAHSFNSRSKPIVFPDLYEASIEELQNGMEAGHFTSVDLVKVSCNLHLDKQGKELRNNERRVFLGSMKSIFKGLPYVLSLRPIPLHSLRLPHLTTSASSRESEGFYMVFPSFSRCIVPRSLRSLLTAVSG